MSQKVIWFLSLFFAALALVPTMAHLMEMPNKLQLSRDEYMTVQQIGFAPAISGNFRMLASAIFNIAALVALIVAVTQRAVEERSPSDQLSEANANQSPA